MSPEHMADPWPGLAILRDHRPVYFDETMGLWVVSRAEDMLPINRSFSAGDMPQQMSGKYFADATTFMAIDGSDHRKRRALLAPYFTRSGVEGFRETIERRARTLLDPIFERERQAVVSGDRRRGEMDWVAEFTAHYAVEVMIDMLDLTFEDFDRYQKWIAASIAADLNITLDPEIGARAQRAKEDSGEYLLPIIAERRTGDGQDFISYLCRAELDGLTFRRGSTIDGGSLRSRGRGHDRPSARAS
jgi:cytochrome P450